MRDPRHLSRPVVLVLGAVMLLVALFDATPAGAHASFLGAPAAFPISTDQSLTMEVPHERDDVTYNVEVKVALGDGWTATGCEASATWTCTHGVQDGRQVVRFVKDAGAGPAADEVFRFSVRTASAVGTFPFPTIQTYNTGETVSWIGQAGSEEPAPVLKTVQPGGPVQTTAPTTTPSHSPPTTKPATPTTRPGTSPTTGAPSGGESGGGSSTGGEVPSPGASTTTTKPGASPSSTSTSAVGGAASEVDGAEDDGVEGSDTGDDDRSQPEDETAVGVVAAGASDSSTGGSGGGGGPPLLLLVVVALAVAGGGYLAYRRWGPSVAAGDPSA